VKPVFLLGCYGGSFHGTGDSAQLCQNFGISGGGGGVEPPHGTPLTYSMVVTVHVGFGVARVAQLFEALRYKPKFAGVGIFH
jgi:hypothetical protein